MVSGGKEMSEDVDLDQEYDDNDIWDEDDIE
jgi:hypothetical protein